MRRSLAVDLAGCGPCPVPSGSGEIRGIRMCVAAGLATSRRIVDTAANIIGRQFKTRLTVVAVASVTVAVLLVLAALPVFVTEISQVPTGTEVNE